MSTCTTRSRRWQTSLFYTGLVVNTIFFSLLVGMIVNVGVFRALVDWGITPNNLSQVAWIAALPTNEPAFMKLLPVLILILWGFSSTVFILLFGTMYVTALVHFPDIGAFSFIGIVLGIPLVGTLLLSIGMSSTRFRCTDFLQNRWRAGLVVGMTAGLFELYFRNLPEFHLYVWENSNFTIGQLPPVLLHVTTGTLIGATVATAFSTKSDWNWQHILAAVVGGSIIHWVFNTWLQAQVWFWKGFYDVFSVVVP